VQHPAERQRGCSREERVRVSSREREVDPETQAVRTQNVACRGERNETLQVQRDSRCTRPPGER